jgi:RNA polymerase sigma factor (sigma-70 family)
MFISASCINDIVNSIQKEYIYKEALLKYFPKKEIREEFFQEAMLYILERPEHMIEIYNAKYFKYWFLNMVKNQVISNNSDWHRNFRKPLTQLTDNLPEETEEPNHFEQEEIEYEHKKKKFKLKLINQALDHYMNLDPTFKADGLIFHMYYIDGLTMRQISDKMFDTPLTTIYRSIQSTEHMVRWYIKKHHPNIKIDD